jgi:tetratricopeptide (TPR) repeat protein
LSVLTSEFTHFIERLFEPSVVLLCRDDVPWATGFFVSEDGLLCCCHHGYDPMLRPRVSMRWNNARHDLTYLPSQSSPAEDFCCFQADLLALGLARTNPVPVSPDDIASVDPGGPAIALGFAGITDPLAPVRLRAFEGTFSGIELYGRPSLGRAVHDIETRDLTIGPGNSGGPLLDVTRFRVIGYVQGTLAGVWERMGRASTLSALRRAQPHLPSVWREAGAKFDAAKRRHFDDLRQPIPIEIATPEDIRALVSDHNQRIIATLQVSGIYSPDLFVSRAISSNIERFINSGDARIALLIGEAGAGKTNILVNLCHQLAETPTMPVLVLGASLNAATTVDAILADLHIRGDLQEILRRASAGDVVLIVDGYNEWPSASRAHFRDLISRLSHILRDLSRVRVIIGAKTEFLRQHAHELFASTDTDPQTIGLYREFLHHEEPDREERSTTGDAASRTKKGRPQPFIEVGTLHDEAAPGARSEQEAMYERYRSQQTMRDAAGHTVGIRPLTSYDDLPDAVRVLLDRPLLLRQFMIRYDGEPAPAGGLRSSFYREVLTPNLSKFLPSGVPREVTEILLGKLARHLCRHGLGSAPLRQLMRETWFDHHIIELLVSHTFILFRLRSPRSVIEGTTIGFSSEWLLEYYLAVDIWEDITLDSEREAYLRAAADDLAKSPLYRFAGALTFVGEWALERDQSALLDLLRAASEEAGGAQWGAFVKSFFEFVRTHYSFVRPLPFDTPGAQSSFAEILVSHHQELRASLLRRVLEYVESLGDRGLRDSIGLLSLDERLWQNLGPTWQAEVVGLRALKRFRLESDSDAKEALAECEQLDPASAPTQVRSLIAFVTGRCHQWFGRYDAAMQAYTACKDNDDPYGAMCRHQIAFIRFFQKSDYRGAAALLDELARALGTRSFGDGPSTLLYGNCLIELGRFAEAYELVDGMSRRRTRGLGRARALRTLANLHFRTFETDLAVRAAERAAAQSREADNAMPHAEANEILAATLAWHLGEIPAALECVRLSRATAAKRNHGRSISWFAQTEALIHAVTGDQGAVEDALRAAKPADMNPNQHRRSSLIRMITAHCGRQSSLDPTVEDVATLRAEYALAGQSWYCAILDLLLWGRNPQDASARQAAFASFPKGISEAGLEQSYLFRVLRRDQ